MTNTAKKVFRRLHGRGTKLGSNSLPQKDAMKGKRQEVIAGSHLIEQYKEFFSPQPIPSLGSESDGDSLEQPSALKSVPSNTTPTLNAWIDAKLA